MATINGGDALNTVCQQSFVSTKNQWTRIDEINKVDNTHRL